VGAVRDPWRDHRHVPGTHGARLPVDVELELALEHDDDLLLLVDVGGSDRVGRERHEVGHRVLAEHRTERQPGDEFDGVDVVDPDEATRPRGHTMGLAAEVAFTLLLVILNRPAVEAGEGPAQACLPTLAPASRAVRQPTRSLTCRERFGPHPPDP
jgi:hypothetical protein